MNPEADDLYELLGVPPTEPQPDVGKRIAVFQVRYGTEYPDRFCELERSLTDIDRRREYNRRNGYPTTFADVALSIDAPDVTTIGEDVPITVVDRDGDPVPDVTVSMEGDVVGSTGGDGLIAVEFDVAGAVTIEATKADESDRTYSDASTDIDVVRERQPLHLEADAEQVSVRDPVTFTVTDGEGRPIEDAIVEPTEEAAREWEARTDSDGICRASFEKAGSWTVTVRKEDTADSSFMSDEIALRVEPSVVQLQVSTDRDTVVVGEPLGITVTDKHGSPVPNVTVQYDGGRVTTDTKGAAELTFDDVGQKSLTAIKSAPNAEYESDTIDVTVEPNRGTPSKGIESRQASIKFRAPSTLTVREPDGTPVSGAEIVVDETTVGTTDADGTITLALDAIRGTVAAHKRQDES